MRSCCSAEVIDPYRYGLVIDGTILSAGLKPLVYRSSQKLN